MNVNKNTSKCADVSKALVREKFKSLKACIRKTRSKIK